MKVKFSGLLKTDVTGEWETDVKARDVADLISKLIAQYGLEFEKKVMEDGRIKWNILLLVNGTLINQIDMSRTNSDRNSSKPIMNTKLHESDTVSIFELVCG